MAVTPSSWLIDKSVLTLLKHPHIRAVVLPRIQAGRVGVSVATELEVGFSARSTDDYLTTRAAVLDHLLPVSVTPRAEQRAREIQRELVERGQHRAVSIPDLLVAAIADVERLTVLHYDGDFDLVAGITGQFTEWVVPRGSVD